VNELPPPGSTLRQVLPGTPEDLDELAALLESYVDGAAAAARGLRSMDSGAWIGEAAAAFWSSVGDVLKKLDEAAAAFQEAVFALRTYTAVLREAQADACRALGLIDQADSDSRLWAAKNADAVVQNVTAPYTGVVAPVSPDDPGEALRHQAHTLITDAKDRLAAAARHAAERLDMAADHAPRKPGFLSRSWHVVSEVASGAAESVTEMATFTFKLSPAYAIVDPDGYVEHGVGLIKGLAYGATHPVDFAKAVLDWDTWAESPGRALGHLVPAIALAVATAGAGAAGKASSSVKGAEALAAGERAEGVAGRALQGLEEVAAGAARPLRPAKQAAALQGTRVYPGIDAWENVTLKAGTKVFAGEPGVTGFATSAKGAAAAGNDAAVLNKGLQIAPHAGTFRPGLTEFRLTKDVEAAKSIALANPQFGPGGIEQFYIPNFGEVTEPIVSTIMRNRAP
jgi:type VII secretion system ESX-1 substrate